MKLVKLNANNIFSLGEVSLNLLNRGIVLVTGYSDDDNSSNGAGKSSLANHAIVWGLYGQTYDGSKGDSVINRNSGKDYGWVMIDFIGQDYNVYRVFRSRNPNKLQLGIQTDGGVLDISHKLERETQKMIDSRLGRDFDTFIHSDLIGPGTERSFFKLSGAEQVSIIETLLPINQLDGWAEMAKRRVTHLKEKINNANKEFSILIGKKESLSQQLNSIQNQDFAWQSNNAKELVIAKTALANVEKDKADKELAIKAIDDKIIALRRSLPIAAILNLEGAVDTRKDDLTALNATLKVKLDQLQFIVNCNSCGTCGRSTTEEEKKKALEGISELLVDKDRVEIELEHVSDWMEKRRQFNELAGQRKLQEESLKNQNNDIYENVVKQLEEAVSPYIAPIQGIQSTISELNSKAEELKIVILSDEMELKWAEFWSNGYSKDLKTMMIEEICPFLESRINDYLQKLNNPQFKVTVSTVKSLKSGDIREKFNLAVRSTHGADSFDLLSVGEKQLVSFAASLAVADLATSQVSGEAQILILDEPFMGLDQNNCANIINFLNTCNKGTILLISNEEEIKSLVPNKIKIVKNKGVSWLE